LAKEGKGRPRRRRKTETQKRTTKRQAIKASNLVARRMRTRKRSATPLMADEAIAHPTHGQPPKPQAF
jgi:hypothetical protein